jgi:hypothetical protein
MRPVFKELNIICLEPMQHQRFVITYPSTQYMVMSALDNGDGVDLQPAQLIDCAPDSIFSSAKLILAQQSLSRKEQAPCFFFTDMHWMMVGIAGARVKGQGKTANCGFTLTLYSDPVLCVLCTGSVPL